MNITKEDLLKIDDFTKSVDGLIEGKFILPDIKITNILKIIASNPSLYEFIKSSLKDFSFDKFLIKALASNAENNGKFIIPEDKKALVAFVFCFLVECDAKRIDYFNFIKTNFKPEADKTDYQVFAETILVPFKEYIYSVFYGLEEDSTPEVEQKPDIYSQLKQHLNTMLDNIIIDRRIKSAEKENLQYLIKNIIYSMKYQDIKIINAFITVLDLLSDRYACLRLPLKDIKSDLLNYYKGI